MKLAYGTNLDKLEQLIQLISETFLNKRHSNILINVVYFVILFIFCLYICSSLLSLIELVRKMKSNKKLFAFDFANFTIILDLDKNPFVFKHNGEIHNDEIESDKKTLFNRQKE